MSSTPKYFLLIAGDNYYPCRGVGDWIASFESEEEAIQSIEKISLQNAKTDFEFFKFKINGQNYDWYHIIDLRSWVFNDS